ncbi:hypothetical protein ABT095_08065 [Kitasatospora sp. NPDC002227]|uniref:hypothetical protein n=1 Tax=Kitasatospora sp. NPDC002227 TaxID=3154773 RepID=UPI00331CF0AA
MLAVDVRQPLRDGKTVLQGASRWWRYGEQTVAEHGDFLLAFVEGQLCVGAFEIRGAERVTGEGGKYAFDLVPAARFEWALLRHLPLTAGRNPARVLTGSALREFLDSAPPQNAASLEPTVAEEYR